MDANDPNVTRMIMGNVEMANKHHDITERMPDEEYKKCPVLIAQIKSHDPPPRTVNHVRPNYSIVYLSTDPNISGSSNTCGATSPSPHACGTKLDSLGTFRGRIGYAMGATGNWLPYVTGGLAVGELNAWDSLFPASGSDFRAGWTVGGGVEVGITRNWTAKIEYLYVDLGSQQMFNIVPGVPETVSFTANIIHGGINYRF
jgi:opacity protein-like surface antigen